jgi:hypothetical protein
MLVQKGPRKSALKDNQRLLMTLDVHLSNVDRLDQPYPPKAYGGATGRRCRKTAAGPPTAIDAVVAPQP